MGQSYVSKRIKSIQSQITNKRVGEIMENKPNFDAIIPANVRYDAELSPNAKLLYSEITALCNEKGYCWANNRYFMELYGISDRQIRNLLKQLSDKNFIHIELINNTTRKIYIVQTPEKNFLPLGKKFPSTPEKNFTHNNKMNNKKIINIMPEWLGNELFDYDWLNDK